MFATIECDIPKDLIQNNAQMNNQELGRSARLMLLTETDLLFSGGSSSDPPSMPEATLPCRTNSACVQFLDRTYTRLVGRCSNQGARASAFATFWHSQDADSNQWNCLGHHTGPSRA